MGCDIHMYVEFQRPGGNVDYWRGWPRMNPGRHYELFGHIAGVRSPVEPVVPPRGVPEALSFHSRFDNTVFIDYEGDGKREGHTTPERAQRWVETAGCKYVLVREGDERPGWVTNPDWHSHTWLTLDEFREALTRTDAEAEREGYTTGTDEYWALVAAMKYLEIRGYTTRVVIWFDN